MSSSAHIIVFRSSQPGSGKSTAAMHVAVGLVRLGYSVASVDLDAINGTLSRYMANRFEYAEATSPDLPSPNHLEIEKDNINALKDHKKAGMDFLRMAIEKLRDDFEFIIIDTASSDDFFAPAAETYSDTLITSVVDDFSGLIETARHIRDLRHTEAKNLRWIILHNRLPPGQNGPAIPVAPGVKFVPGFAERDLFAGLFASGLTLLDIRESGELTLSALAARQEARQLLRAIEPERLKGYPQEKHP